jgi:hypothetical protein
LAVFAAVSASLTLACELTVQTNDLSGAPDDDSGGSGEAGVPDSVTGTPDARDSAVTLGQDTSAPEASVDSGANTDSTMANGDTGAIDSTAVDSSSGDTGTGVADSSIRDTGTPDTGIPDTGTVVDSGIPDMGGPDAHAVTCAAGGARVFVTNEMFTGDLGGLSGADQSCKSAAAAAGLGGTTWNAFLSDSNTSALNRIYKVSGGAGYTLVDGTKVAANWSSLVSKNTPLLHAIDHTELGTVVTNNFEVWTGTDLTGVTPPGYCDSPAGSWTSFSHNAGTPFVGVTDNTNPAWTDVYEQFCDVTTERLYCFERCP